MKSATISKAGTGTHKPLVTGSIPVAATKLSHVIAGKPGDDLAPGTLGWSEPLKLDT